MGYPFCDVGIGYGVLMAVIAILHVFVSHFAIGGGLYLVVTETAARRAGDTQKLEFLRGLTKFFVLVTLVFGALTGVGIWFTVNRAAETVRRNLEHPLLGESGSGDGQYQAEPNRTDSHRIPPLLELARDYHETWLLERRKALYGGE
jgi:hypothetical protein